MHRDDAAIYLTDDRDLPLKDQRTLVIFHGGNGDWYVQVCDYTGRGFDGVRLCTSGGASSACPGLTTAIKDAYDAIRGKPARSRYDLEQEVTAWRERFPHLDFNNFDIVEKE